MVPGRGKKKHVKRMRNMGMNLGVNVNIINPPRSQIYFSWQRRRRNETVLTMEDDTHEPATGVGPQQFSHEEMAHHQSRENNGINIYGSIVAIGDINHISVVPDHCKEQPDAGAVRERYISLCELHEIQYVHNDVIKTKKFPINQFAVKLKMVSNRVVDKSFRGELNRYLEDLNSITNCDINIENLIDKDTRVTFLRGIAGIGKSVLAKQIAYFWAKGTIYSSFDVCLFFECRELNDFMRKNTGHSVEETLHRFVEMKLSGLKIQNRGKVLIIIDGVDELFDIKDENSLLFHFLDMSKSFGKAKIIMTGRPHVEGVLDQLFIHIGRYKVVEVMGLGDKDIEEYIEKFTTCFGKMHLCEYREAIARTINGSVNIRPILCVPQFLNAICCVSILTGGKEIGNETELYSWTLYLLFKQHVFERERAKDKSLICNVFTTYQQLISVLSEISSKLYSENQIIFTQNDFQPLFDKIYNDKSILGIAKGFFDGLFGDKSDNYKTKLQFKHLSLMEYLTAIHICSMRNPIDIVENLLKNESFDIVRYICGLYGGLFQDEIVKELYTCVIEVGKDTGKTTGCHTDRREEAMSFLMAMFDLLCNSEFHEGIKFSKSVEFAVQFLCPQFDQTDFVNNVLGKLSSIGNQLFYNPDVTEQRMLFRFFNIITAIGIDEKILKTALGNTGIGLHSINDIGLLTLVQYFNASDIDVEDTKVDKHGMGIITDNLIYCRILRFGGCVFENQFVEAKHSWHDSKLDLLALTRCKVERMSFKTFSKWAVLSSKVELNGDMAISSELWEIFAMEIDKAQQTGLKLEKLHIAGATFDERSWEGAVKVFVEMKEVSTEKTDIRKEWWKTLVDEVEERKNEGILKLSKLLIKWPSNMTGELQRTMHECGVEVTFGESMAIPPPSTSSLGSSLTQGTKIEPNVLSNDFASSLWLISDNSLPHNAVDVPVKTLNSELIYKCNEDELEHILSNLNIVIKDSHGCVPPASIQERIIFETILDFVNQNFAKEDGKKFEIFDNLVRHVRFNALMKFERESLEETMNNLADRELACKCTTLLQRVENNTVTNQMKGSLSRSAIAPVPFNSKKLAHCCETKVVRKFNDQSSPTDIYIKGMTIWMRRWRRIPVCGGVEVLYSDGTKMFHGERFGHEVHRFVLSPDEYIVKVIACSGYMVDSLEFVTNTGKSYGPYGGSGGNQSILCHPDGSGYLSHVSGSEVESLGSLGIVSLSFHFVLCPEPVYRDNGKNGYGNVQ